MPSRQHWEEKIEKRYRQKEKRKTRKMKVSGKSVFGLKKIIVSRDAQLRIREGANPPHP